jgi:hypothetical protein
VLSGTEISYTEPHREKGGSLRLRLRLSLRPLSSECTNESVEKFKIEVKREENS